MKIALSIAGSDSGGGAGIQADLKTFEHFGTFGTTVLVAVTAQNTLGVSAVHLVPDAVVRAQLAALAADLPPAALKTGMLATAACIATVAETVAAAGWGPLVVDPVMVATSGDRLLAPDADLAYRERLFPLAALVTPNLDEAEVLCGFPVRDVPQMTRAGATLLRMGAAAALVKGGHGHGDEVLDVLVTRDGSRTFRHPRLASTSTHGTGCTLSAAITALLALGHPLEPAVEAGLDYTWRAIRDAPGLGAGRGPVRHGVSGER
ncbi:MAG: bifunctional hydroxymethylpyrimidine kinase/phosphomethylpyrimidine kinase [Gemmatimonadales bacterium]|jgi:hydroxymethylpyrimidine/phosphomethylpyrimidine kinase|nr:bifunctional hydroxymethylpyrimidine kinase/phosphomethylpyrimidine kinase [Gemmatimonadales bacterium]